MARKEFSESITKAFEGLKPSTVELLEFQEEAAHVLVVSDAFEGMNLTSRLDNLYDRVQEHGIDAKRLILSFEPYTQAEFDEAERLSKDEKSRSLLESHHVAASS